MSVFNIDLKNMYRTTLDDIVDFDSIPDFDRLQSIGPLQYYLSLITSEYQNSPNFMSFLQLMLTPLLDAAALMDNMYSSFDIDSAVGNQLDLIGNLVGQIRTVNFQPTNGSSPTLDDENYRVLLKCKVIQNTWDGTIPDLYNRWTALFPGGDIIIEDNQDMSFNVLLVGNFSSVISDLVNHGYIVPRPCGVLNNNQGIASTGNLPVFGFDMQTDYVNGFDIGSWTIAELV